jgi:hypothetical protein
MRGQGRAYMYQETEEMYIRSVSHDPESVRVRRAYMWSDLSELAPTSSATNLVWSSRLGDVRLLRY